jgi:hypothetical protein
MQTGLWRKGFQAMISPHAEENVADIMFQVFAEYLTRWESRQHILQDQVSIGMGRTIPDTVNLLPSLRKNSDEMRSCDDLLVEKSLDKSEHDCITGDGHAQR